MNWIATLNYWNQLTTLNWRERKKNKILDEKKYFSVAVAGVGVAGDERHAAGAGWRTPVQRQQIKQKMARNKNIALRRIRAKLCKLNPGMKMQLAVMQTRPQRVDGRSHGAMPSKRRGSRWTKPRKSQKWIARLKYEWWNKRKRFSCEY